MIALEALASNTSDSLIAPTVERITLTLAPSTLIFSNVPFTASAVPLTSALTIIFKFLRLIFFVFDAKIRG